MKLRHLFLFFLAPLCSLLSSCPSPDPKPSKKDKLDTLVSQQITAIPQTEKDEKLISFKGIKAKVPKSTVQEQTMNDDGYELLSMTVDGYLFKFAQLHQNTETGKDYQSVYDNFKTLNILALKDKPVRTLNGKNTLVEYYRFQGIAIGVIKRKGDAILRFTFTPKSDPKSQQELDTCNAFFDTTIKPILRSTTY